MLNNPVLNAVIGLILIFLLYSLLATIVQEMLATRLSLRSGMLQKALSRMLDSEPIELGLFVSTFRRLWFLAGPGRKLSPHTLTGRFYMHPLIRSYGEDGNYPRPAYLSAADFSLVLVSLLQGSAAANAQQLTDALMQGCITIPGAHYDRYGSETEPEQLMLHPDTARLLQSFWLHSAGDIGAFRQQLEQWFLHTMDRATGWYKRFARQVLFLIGGCMALGFNLDAIGIAGRLQAAALNAHTAEAGGLLGLGWARTLGAQLRETPSCLVGWLISALAISLGAPFWFDLLARLMNLRGAVTAAQGLTNAQTLIGGEETKNTLSKTVNAIG